jgi:hypothetical protein
VVKTHILPIDHRFFIGRKTECVVRSTNLMKNLREIPNGNSEGKCPDAPNSSLRWSATQNTPGRKKLRVIDKRPKNKQCAAAIMGLQKKAYCIQLAISEYNTMAEALVAKALGRALCSGKGSWAP